MEVKTLIGYTTEGESGNGVKGGRKQRERKKAFLVQKRYCNNNGLIRYTSQRKVREVFVRGEREREVFVEMERKVEGRVDKKGSLAMQRLMETERTPRKKTGCTV